MAVHEFRKPTVLARRYANMMVNGSKWRLDTVLAASAALLWVAMCFAAVIVPDRGWDEMAEWAARATEEYEARDFTRHAAWGDLQPGRAAEHYARAEAIARANTADHDELVTLCRILNSNGDPLPEREEAELRGRWAPAVVAMREGARCVDARPRFPVGNGFAAPTVNMHHAQWIVKLAALEARDHAAAGRGGEAVRTLLDAATYGADYLLSPSLLEQCIGLAILTIAMDEASKPSLLAQLDLAALELLDAGIEVLSARFAMPMRCDDAMLLANWLLQDPGRLEEAVPWASSTWRQWFSRETVVLDAVVALREIDDQLQSDAAPRDWPARRQWIADLQARLPRVASPFFFRNVEAPERHRFRVLAQVQVLRGAIAVLRGGMLPQLIDPFSGLPLAVVEGVDGSVTLCSVGDSRVRPMELTVTRRR